MKKQKGNHTTAILVLILFIGLSLLLYPSVSNYWNSFHQTRAIANYAEEVAHMDTSKYEQMWDAAQAYNRKLVQHGQNYVLDEAQKAEYEQTLDVSGTGIMGYIEIPSIRCTLPIYHGVEESVLQIAVGHLDWTSLPVGGESTHCVLSGHRGLPSAQLFTHLDKLIEGDVFILRVLDEVLTYEVDQILIVEPQETASLQIVEGEDYCTLVTCTPYGINSHRLLIRGHRIENIDNLLDIRVTADAIQLEPLLVAPVVAIPILLLLVVVLLLPKQPKTKSMRGRLTEEMEHKDSGGDIDAEK